VLSDKKKSKKQVAPPLEKRMGWVCTNMIKEDLNGWCSKDLTPKSKFKPLVEKGPKAI
jgi:hypothetical protein